MDICKIHICRYCPLANKTVAAKIELCFILHRNRKTNIIMINDYITLSGVILSFYDLITNYEPHDN